MSVGYFVSCWFPMHESIQIHQTRLGEVEASHAVYLYRTKEEFLTLKTDDLSMIGCWIDVAYASHQDMRSHTGGFPSLGTDGVMSGSNKQKLNSTSSAESELIACNAFSRKGALFSKVFLQAQGYK